MTNVTAGHSVTRPIRHYSDGLDTRMNRSEHPTPCWCLQWIGFAAIPRHYVLSASGDYRTPRPTVPRISRRRKMPTALSRRVRDHALHFAEIRGRHQRRLKAAPFRFLGSPHSDSVVRGLPPIDARMIRKISQQPAMQVSPR